MIYPAKVRYLIIVTSVLSMGLFIKNLHYLFHLNSGDALFFLAIVAASLFVVPLPKGNGSVSVQLPVIFSTAIILGPAAGLWLGGLASTTGPEYLGKVRWPSVVFNRAQFALSGWAGGEMFYLMAGSANHLGLAQVSLPLGSAAITSFLLNWGFVMAAISLRTKRPLIETFRVHFKWSTPSFVLMIPIAYSMAAVYKELGPYGELIFIIPLASIRYILALLRRAYITYFDNIDILLTALNFRDAYTYGHSIRVGHYAGKLAGQFQMPQDRVQLVKEAGLLHDVGKLSTPDMILNKVGRLNHEEITVIKDHPVIGSEILEQLRVGGCARHFVRQHHERWDGVGYPDKLTGEQIALETRIVSVVDAYDAMTTDRPYRRGMVHSVALKEIQRGSGNQFDPEVVQKFVEMCGDKNLVEEETIAQGWNHVGLRTGGGNKHGRSS